MHKESWNHKQAGKKLEQTAPIRQIPPLHPHTITMQLFKPLRDKQEQSIDKEE